jgi:hypothetical protein
MAIGGHASVFGFLLNIAGRTVQLPMSRFD